MTGSESGGHGSAIGSPVISLLPSVLRAIEKSGHQKPVVLAAGGIVTGDQIAAMLTLGADGIVLGTRLLATPEALFSQSQKDAIVAASSSNATVRTTLFDTMRGTLGWPDDVDGRALINDTVREEAEGKSQADLKAAYAEAVKTKDVKRIVTWAGA